MKFSIVFLSILSLSFLASCSQEDHSGHDHSSHNFSEQKSSSGDLAIDTSHKIKKTNIDSHVGHDL